MFFINEKYINSLLEDDPIKKENILPEILRKASMKNVPKQS